MTLNDKAKFGQSHCGKVILIGSRLLVATVFLGIFCPASAFGQADYSDMWVDDSNPDAAYIVGAGVTEDDYTNGGGDAIGVETTITSPNGRTQSGSADGDTDARVEVTLPWDWNDLGEYFVQTRHQPLCYGNWDGSLIYETRSGGNYYWHYNSDYFRCYESRASSTARIIGYSQSCYRLDHVDFSYLNPWVYKIVGGCTDRISC